ncbi:hypothetical protein [Palleronia sp. LCG004]|nr:hypothetical protein [Palleronia sp. LCG004]WOI57444.1 hypothetical protein RVY76_06575 [Palleronia sp. LCG004]
MTTNSFAKVRELGLLALVLVTLAVPALLASGNGIRPLDTAYLLTLSDQ